MEQCCIASAQKCSSVPLTFSSLSKMTSSLLVPPKIMFFSKTFNVGLSLPLYPAMIYRFWLRQKANLSLDRTLQNSVLDSVGNSRSQSLLSLFTDVENFNSVKGPWQTIYFYFNVMVYSVTYHAVVVNNYEQLNVSTSQITLLLTIQIVSMVIKHLWRACATHSIVLNGTLEHGLKL